MSIDRISPGQATIAPRPAWQVALVAVIVLLVLSEAAYLLAGAGAKRCIDDALTCPQALSWLSNSVFAYADGESGARMFIVKTMFGLPGFNTLFYLMLGSVGIDYMIPFATSGIAALLIAFLALWGSLALAAGRDFAVRLASAAIFAPGWVALYTQAESSMFGSDFMSSLPMHAYEIPVAFIGLIAASLFAGRRAG